MWGLSPYDDNDEINAYKQNFGVTNPCAGTEGGAPQAIEQVIEGQQFFGYPTYCVICPDKKLQFNVCFPPSEECFATFINGCMETSVDEALVQSGDELLLYPNPANEVFTLKGKAEGAVKLRIFDFLGVPVFSSNFSAAGEFLRVIDLDDFSPGIYFVSLETRKGRTVERLSIR